jgi:hypothetical protein
MEQKEEECAVVKIISANELKNFIETADQCQLNELFKYFNEQVQEYHSLHPNDNGFDWNYNKVTTSPIKLATRDEFERHLRKSGYNIEECLGGVHHISINKPVNLKTFLGVVEYVCFVVILWLLFIGASQYAILFSPTVFWMLIGAFTAIFVGIAPFLIFPVNLRLRHTFVMIAAFFINVFGDE